MSAEWSPACQHRPDILRAFVHHSSRILRLKLDISNAGINRHVSSWRDCHAMRIHRSLRLWDVCAICICDKWLLGNMCSNRRRRGGVRAIHVLSDFGSFDLHLFEHRAAPQKTEHRECGSTQCQSISFHGFLVWLKHWHCWRGSEQVLVQCEGEFVPTVEKDERSHR
jgi:hypothetical protein